MRRRLATGLVVATAMALAAAPEASAQGPLDCSSTTLSPCIEYCVIGVYDGGPTYPCHVHVDPVDVREVVDRLETIIEMLEPDVGDVPNASTGGGAATGSVAFAWPGVPPAGQPCRTTSFTLSGTSAAFAVNTVITGYAGPVTLTGSGGSSCETASAGSGTLTLNATGTGPTGSTVSCTGLSGGYARVGSDVTAVLGGTCVVNNFPAKVSFVFRGEFLPSGTGAGVTTSIREASFHGPFVVVPA